MSISTFTKASIASSIILLLSGQASAAGYKFTDLNGTLLYSTAKGINLSGQVVGTIISANGQSAARWDKGVARELRYANENGYGAGINDAGQVAAFSGSDSDWDSGKALVWKGDRATVVAAEQRRLKRSILSVSGINNKGAVLGVENFDYHDYQQSTVWNGANTTSLGQETIGNSINDGGQVVGYFNLSNQAFSWKNGVLTILPGGLGSNYGEARAVNNAGLVVGFTVGDDFNDPSRAVLWKDGKAIGLPTLHGDKSKYTTAEALNNVGQIVGEQEGGSALLWEDGNVIDLNTFLSADLLNEGWRLTEATGVNDHGWIVGNMVKGTGSATQTHAFMLMPVPEPETYAMLLAGLGLIGFVARRRRG